MVSRPVSPGVPKSLTTTCGRKLCAWARPFFVAAGCADDDYIVILLQKAGYKVQQS
jgi:hypothetical protein